MTNNNRTAQKSGSRPGTLVQPIHFEDFGGEAFERLVFAYHARSDRWRSLEWYGQVGSDLGRDIWGVREKDGRADETVCIQCACRTRVTYAKVARDIDKVVLAPTGKPDCFRLVSSSALSSALRDNVKRHAREADIAWCEAWSGAEFEELLRGNAESLLQRFVEGVVFPDSPAELRDYVRDVGATDDDEVLALYARLFDRPAFYTPLEAESSMPAFKQAITDTIEALGTGNWKTRDGYLIARLPSRHGVRDAAKRSTLQRVEIALAKLRAKYDEFYGTEIRPCGCGQPDCAVHMLSPLAVRELGRLRTEALDLFRHVRPTFSLPTW